METRPKRKRRKSVWVSAAGFTSPTRLVSFFLEAGCEHSEMELTQDETDGTWQGVAKVAPYVAKDL